MRDDFKWNSTRQTNEGGSPVNSWERKTNVTTQLIFNVKVSDGDGMPPYSIWWSYWRCHCPPPIKNNNLRFNFCGGHFDLSGGDNLFSKEPILFTALVSRTANMAMKYSGTISINRCNSRTLCAEGGVCTGLGEHMDPRGWGLWEAVHKTRNTIVHILHLLQIISSVASGPWCHVWQGVAVNSITYDICRKNRSWNYRPHHLRTSINGYETNDLM